jgi:hypothetical protein
MTPTDLKALIADIEAGPVTRELSDRVLLAFGWKKVGVRELTAQGEKIVHFDDPNGKRFAYFLSGKHRSRREIPSPLTSLDDAMKMVPEGYDWRVDSDGLAEVTHGEVGFECGDHFSAYIEDELAVALSLAALKARLAMEDDYG